MRGIKSVQSSIQHSYAMGLLLCEMVRLIQV